MLKYLGVLFVLFFLFGNAQQEVFIITPTGNIYGDLLADSTRKDEPIIYFIGGSGASTKEGIGDSQKQLANALWEKGIQSLSVDKRGAGKSSAAFTGEESFRFDSLVNDAINWVDYLKKEGFTNIIIAGHSQGSLVGMIAAQKTKVSKYISLAGAGRTIDFVLKEQLANMLPVFRDSAYSVLDGLKQGITYDTISPYLYSLFRPSIQPFMISWIKYNPATEIKKLDIPALIIQGTTDIQVSVEDAELLHSAFPSSELQLIKGMNHIFKDAPIDRAANTKTYTDTSLPPNNELIKVIVEFCKK